MIEKYYLVSWQEDDALGVAYSSRKDLTSVDDAAIVALGLFILHEGDFSDYQANNKGLRLCSEKLKTVIESLAIWENYLQWTTINVFSEQKQETRPYYALRFVKEIDNLDESHTVFAAKGRFVVKPCFSAKKIAGINIFKLPGMDGRWYVSNTLRKEIIKAETTGMVFEKTCVIQ